MGVRMARSMMYRTKSQRRHDTRSAPAGGGAWNRISHGPGALGTAEWCCPKANGQMQIANNRNSSRKRALASTYAPIHGYIDVTTNAHARPNH